MKQNICLNLNLIIFKIIILSGFVIYSSLLLECTKNLPFLKNEQCVEYCNKEQIDSGGCEISFPILKTKWLNNIITFENTIGDFYLNLENINDANKIIFATTLLNNKRLYYGIEYGEKYFIKDNKNNSNYIQYVIKNIDQNENNEMTYGDISLMNLIYNYVIFIGNKNFFLEIINLDIETDYIKSFSINEFLNETRTIQGVSSFSYILNANNLVYITVTTKNDNPSKYYLSFFVFLFNVQEKSLLPQLNSLMDYDDIKGEYFNCFYSSNKFISCFYLNKENNYIIAVFPKEGENYVKKTSIIVDSPAVTNENNFYFLKGVSITATSSIYVYYSGSNNDIPTFIFKKIDKSSYEISDYSSNIPNVYLNDYYFNNDIRYNDLISKSSTEVYFVSTNKEKEILIIAEIRIYTSNSQNQVSIRYFNIEFKKYYNMKILNGFKAVFFKNIFLTLAFDYCIYDSCPNSNEKKGNSGLIKFSYFYKLHNNINIDFIEYVFNNNTNYIIIDLIEDLIIENNIFGIKILTIGIENYDEWQIDNGINYYIANTERNLIDEMGTDGENSLINITFPEYSFDKISIKMIFSYILQMPNNVIKYNEYADNYDNSYGDINDQKSYNSKIYFLDNDYYYYYININEDLSQDCNDTNCSLCLRNDIDYCLVCNNKYKIIYDDKYFNGKKKICIKDYIDEEILDFFNGKYNNTILSNEEISNLYEKLKDYIQNTKNENETIIKTGNVNIQISNIDKQKDSKDVSNIYLGDCEEKLKKKYCKSENDSLIMLKFDIKPEKEKSTYVQYEIYDPNTNSFINLNECSGSNIQINIPIDLDGNIELLYDLLSNSGYNLFNSNDSFYNDICATYTTQNGTDILLYDRRMDIYQSTVNISLCQEGCRFQTYDLDKKKALCDCPIQKEEMNLELSQIKFDKNKMLDEFYDTLENSNFRVLKCYKLAFNYNLFIKNIGSIIMSILFDIFLILIIFNIFIIKKKINMLIQLIIKNKFLENSNDQKLNEEKNNKQKLKKKNHNNSNNNCDNTLNENNINEGNYDISKINSTPKDKKRILKKKRKSRKLNSVVESNYLPKNSRKISSLEKIDSTNNTINNLKYNSEFRLAPPKRRKEDLNLERIDSPVIKRRTYKIKTVNEPKQNNNFCLILNDNFSHNIQQNSIQNIKKNNDNKNELLQKKCTLKEQVRKKKKKSSRKSVVGSPKKQKKVSFRKFSHNNTIVFRNRINSNNLKYPHSEKSDDKEIKKEEIKNEEKISLNDEELNSLKYEKALEIDKRTYLQYYLSLIKKKQLIIFTFLPSNDYNLMSLKISLFIVSFSMYLTINGFFFNDETMHKIYVDNGSYNIIYQIPQILYSSVISAIINMILKLLSLSEKDMLKIKQEKDMKDSLILSKKVTKCIIFKFVLFFLFSFLLMSFFWYFISCFCAVYHNTQIILFKDTLISFALSMAYPFGLYLLPGLFRIPALQAKNKDKRCIYSFSQILAFI